jgi:hypothetical protein
MCTYVDLQCVFRYLYAAVVNVLNCDVLRESAKTDYSL